VVVVCGWCVGGVWVVGGWCVGGVGVGIVVSGVEIEGGLGQGVGCRV
jgi:hypothetical protein